MSSVSDAPYDTDHTDAMPQPKKSKRATQRERFNVPLGGDGRPKGLIRFVNGVMEHKENEEGKWTPAVYHVDIRRELIESHNQQETYTHARNKGKHEDDITTFHPEHRTWGPRRQNWPDILFRINKTFKSHQGDSVIEDTVSAPKDDVPLWYHNGKIVLDVDNHPLKLFRELPAVISSEIEGWEMEAMSRRDSRIHHKDIRARMPRVQGKDNSKPPSPPTLMCISMRMSRFREKGALKAWDLRAGSEAINDFIDQILGPACVSTNNSRSFGRILTKPEIDQMRAINRGKFPEKARPRDASNIGTEPTKKRKRGGRPDFAEDEHQEVHEQERLIPAQVNGEASGQVKRRKVDTSPNQSFFNSNRYPGDVSGYPMNVPEPGFQVPGSGPGDYGWTGHHPNSSRNPTDTPSCHYPTPSSSQRYGQCPPGYRLAAEELGVPMYTGQQHSQYPRGGYLADDDPRYFGHQDRFQNGFMEQLSRYPNLEMQATGAAGLSGTMKHGGAPQSRGSREHSPTENGGTVLPRCVQTSPELQTTSPMNGSNPTAVSTSGFPVASPGLTEIDPDASVVSQLSPDEISALANLDDPRFWEDITSGDPSFGLPTPEETQPQGTPSYGTSLQQRTENPPMLENPQDIDFPDYAPTPEQRAIDEWVERCIAAKFGSVNNQSASMLLESAFRLTTKYPE